MKKNITSKQIKTTFSIRYNIVKNDNVANSFFTSSIHKKNIPIPGMGIRSKDNTNFQNSLNTSQITYCRDFRAGCQQFVYEQMKFFV